MSAHAAHIPLLTAEECSRVVERVQANRAAWEQRMPVLPFFTLGAASYLDTEGYRDKAAALNPVLEREFGWLYERLFQALGDHLGAETAFEPDAARPGFHIFLAHEAFRQPLGTVHFDLQYAGIEWADSRHLDFSRPVSYTLALRLPRDGGGLQVWDVTKAECDAAGITDLAEIGRTRKPDHVAYREGGLVCHSGTVLHRIAPAPAAMRADDMRITLQGHALPGRGRYWLYW